MGTWVIEHEGEFKCLINVLWHRKFIFMVVVAFTLRNMFVLSFDTCYEMDRGGLVRDREEGRIQVRGRRRENKGRQEDRKNLMVNNHITSQHFIIKDV